MRIAQITAVKEGLCGGIGRYVFNLAIAQKARGDNPIIVVPQSGGLTAACDEYGIPVVIETHLAGHPTETRKARDQTRKLIDDPAIDYLCSLFAKLDVEVIHCHTPSPGMQAIAAGNRIGIPCVYTHHVVAGVKFPDLQFAVIGAGRSVFERLKKDGFPEERLYYVPNGTKVMPCVGSGSPPPNLISVGRLELIKGFDIAILAIAELRRRHGLDYCPVFNVYGEGSWGEYLQEMVSVLRLDDKVRFHGAQQGILERCPATDILIVSSRTEAGPLVALEAMSRGMPIAAFRVGEMEELIPDQRYGYIAQNRSITALADAIESMLSDVRAGRFDPDLPISRHRELYTLEKMAERVDAIYKSLITRHAPVG